MILCYARDGTPITIEEFANLNSDPNYHRVALSEIGDTTVSTIWLGINHQWHMGLPPLIFETMIFNGPWDENQWRWSTEPAALAGHERIVAALLDGNEPEGITDINAKED